MCTVAPSHRAIARSRDGAMRSMRCDAMRCDAMAVRAIATLSSSGHGTDDDDALFARTLAQTVEFTGLKSAKSMAGGAQSQGFRQAVTPRAASKVRATPLTMDAAIAMRCDARARRARATTCARRLTVYTRVVRNIRRPWLSSLKPRSRLRSTVSAASVRARCVRSPYPTWLVRMRCEFARVRVTTTGEFARSSANVMGEYWLYALPSFAMAFVGACARCARWSTSRAMSLSFVDRGALGRLTVDCFA